MKNRFEYRSSWAACLGVISFVLTACGAGPVPSGQGEEADTAEAVGTSEQAVLGETLNSTPAQWGWHHGLTAAQVTAALQAGKYRLVSLNVESTSPERHDDELRQ
jgi:hypothetical protein